MHVRFASDSDRQPSKGDPALRATCRLMHGTKFGEIQREQIWSSTTGRRRLEAVSKLVVSRLAASDAALYCLLACQVQFSLPLSEPEMWWPPRSCPTQC